MSAESSDVFVYFVEVLFEWLIFHCRVVDRRQWVDVLRSLHSASSHGNLLPRDDGIAVSVVLDFLFLFGYLVTELLFVLLHEAEI